jgi:(S)-citramalyl-CoA lyase
MQKASTPEAVTARHRSLLFLPASVVADPRHPLPDYYHRCVAERLPAEFRPDVFILDLEDSVPLANRVRACRDAAFFVERASTGAATRLFLRVTGTDILREAEQHLAAQPAIEGIVLPKVEWDTVEAIAEGFLGLGKPVWPIIETAKGFLHKAESIRFFRERQAVQMPVCVILGRDDLAASLRIDRDSLTVDRFSAFFLDFVCACRAYGCDAIGPVFNEPDNPRGLLEELSALSTVGFGGTLSVFPQQVRDVNRAFTTPEEVRSRYAAIRAALMQAHDNGMGWILHEGRKYDTADLAYLDHVLAR